ncbi:MAG: hypothetical protein K5770_07335 [Lachnospiraceae bacterium]|nr:hypothetical protein [Lachnospiraceae bacterium]
MTIEKEVRQMQREKFRKMSTKEKCRYILDYYKWHIIVSIFILAVTISLIKDMRANNRPSYLNILLINTSPSFNSEDELTGDIADYCDVDLNEYKISVDSSMFLEEDSSYSPFAMGSAQKFLAVYAAGEVDVMIAPESVIEMYLKANIFEDPMELLDEEDIESLEQAGCTFCYKKLKDMTDPENWDDSMENKDICIGITLNNNSYLKKIGAYSPDENGNITDVIFTFSSVVENKDNAIAFLRMITNQTNF